MSIKRLRFVPLAISLVMVAAVTVGADGPRSSGVTDPTCTNALPCIEYDNNGTGPGIRGISAAGNGLSGSTKNKSTSTANGRAGLMGNDVGTGAFNSGVHGLSVNGTGVSGDSTSGVGVSGASTSKNGVKGTSVGGTAIQGTSSTGVGVWGQSTSNIGVFGISSSAVGVYGEGLGEQPAVKAHNNGLGEGLQSDGYTGAEITGNGVGAIVRSQVGTTNYPLILTDLSHNDLFFVNGNGDVFYHGSLNTFAIATKGNVATAFTSKAASPMVEDTGSGQLINGVAVVSLDPAFAQTIDPRMPYHVMLTPDGDTRGLFVAKKGPTGFVVHEVQGGRSSLVFDYHVYAPSRGHAGERMLVMTQAAASAMMPKVPVTDRPVQLR